MKAADDVIIELCFLDELGKDVHPYYKFWYETLQRVS